MDGNHNECVCGASLLTAYEWGPQLGDLERSIPNSQSLILEEYVCVVSNVHWETNGAIFSRQHQRRRLILPQRNTSDCGKSLYWHMRPWHLKPAPNKSITLHCSNPIDYKCFLCLFFPVWIFISIISWCYIGIKVKNLLARLPALTRIWYLSHKQVIWLALQMTSYRTFPITHSQTQKIIWFTFQYLF